jgi:hypothetical protein
MQETARGLPGVPEAISEAVATALATALAPATTPLVGWSVSAEEVADSPVPLPEDIRLRSWLFAAGAEPFSPAELIPGRRRCL